MQVSAALGINKPRNTRMSKSSATKAVSLLAFLVTPPSIALSSSKTFCRGRKSMFLTMSTSAAAESKKRRPEGASNDHPLGPIKKNFDHSWVSNLSPETQSNRIKSAKYAGRTPPSFDDDLHEENEAITNRKMRPVFNGHYVPVKPRPLKNPRLVVHSTDMATKLGLSPENVNSPAFTQFFSGDVTAAVGHDNAMTWATPYALSIMGRRYTNNCPYGTGDGYGDGRAISIGEVKTESGDRWEMQLKGAGTTPFCRGADGRAVFRSSIREFLASEAMYHLNIETTRALSLIKSDGPDGDESRRPWYSANNARPEPPSLDDPRLAMFSLEQRKLFLAQLMSQSKSDPDVMIMEPNAITCRVAPSFVRVGHLDLFARRAMKGESDITKAKFDTESEEWKELEEMVWHAAFREYHDTAYAPYKNKNDIKSAAVVMLTEAAENIATLVANWIRVGFAQGNFNADNCLVGGRTMDYGPFGFMDEYQPLFAKWTGSGEHFGFLNQPQAGYANYVVLVESVLPVIFAAGDGMSQSERQEMQDKILENAQGVFQGKVDEVFRSKLGFHPEDDAGDEQWENVEPLLRECRADWTLFWHKLTKMAQDFPIQDGSTSFGDMLRTLEGTEAVRQGSSPFYEPLTEEKKAKMLNWIAKWRTALSDSYGDGGQSTLALDADGDAPKLKTPEERMIQSNPKYTLREWMLVDAYTKAANGDESIVHELMELIKDPYGEGTKEQIEKYYRRAPDKALKAGGTAFMT